MKTSYELRKASSDTFRTTSHTSLQVHGRDHGLAAGVRLPRGGARGHCRAAVRRLDLTAVALRDAEEPRRDLAVPCPRPRVFLLQAAGEWTVLRLQ